MTLRPLARLALAGSGLGLAAALLQELRIGPVDRQPTDRWREVRVAKRRNVRLGISFRPRQAEDLGLDVHDALTRLLSYPFEVLRVAAYWDRMDRADGTFDTAELDWQLDAAERAGKQVIVCLGPVKSFGYPEYFVPGHRLDAPLPEGVLIDAGSHPELAHAVIEQLTRLVRRYRHRQVIRAWQVEHEAVDPLGMEHSWRLATSFVRREVQTVRSLDPERPILMNAFLPTSTAVLTHQRWRTRDQGDSLVVAKELADIVGVDVYPRHAVAAVGRWCAYLDGARAAAPAWVRRRLLHWVHTERRELVVTEGQAEPWEAVTVPPSPDGSAPASCTPERLVENYNACMRWAGRDRALTTYLFWGAEYWLLRERQGDRRYLDAFARLLEESARA